MQNSYSSLRHIALVLFRHGCILASDVEDLWVASMDEDFCIPDVCDVVLASALDHLEGILSAEADVTGGNQ